MVENVKKISNPLTIIAVFAALAEINATVVLGLLDKSMQSIFIWFIMIFPIILVLCFFGTLIFKNKVMYSPSDFKDDKSFLDTLNNNYGNIDKSETKYHSDRFSNLFMDFEKKTIEKISKQLDAIRQTSNISVEDIKDVEKVASESIYEFKKEFFDVNKIKDLFYTFPAHFVLLYAIYISHSTSIKELREYSEKFFIPIGWNGGLENLIRINILLGSVESFRINPDCKPFVEDVVMRNRDKILRIQSLCENSPKDSNRKEVLSLGRTIKFA